jgi:hypothetical protein
MRLVDGEIAPCGRGSVRQGMAPPHFRTDTSDAAVARGTPDLWR